MKWSSQKAPDEISTCSTFTICKPLGRGSCIPRQGGRSPLSLSSLYTFTFFTNSMREQHTKWTMVGGGGELHSSSRRKRFRLLWVDGKPRGGRRDNVSHRQWGRASVGTLIVLLFKGEVGVAKRCISHASAVHSIVIYIIHPLRSSENCCDPI